jgi:hypothetical protein
MPSQLALSRRSLRTGLVTLCVLATFSFAPVGAQVATGAATMHTGPKQLVTPPGRVTSHSTNWSGYATFQGGTDFTAVRGRWIQPSATCPVNKAQYASFWIGLDGYNSSSVQQIGTDADCVGQNQPAYYAWFEMYPEPPHSVPVAIHPGDQIIARITTNNGRFRLTLTNQTTGKSFSTTEKNTSARLSSAEWIAEAPSGCNAHGCKVLPLANFGTVDFTGSYTTGDGHEGSISDAAWHRDRITMVNSNNVPKAVPGPLNPNGTAFEVVWQHV